VQNAGSEPEDNRSTSPDPENRTKMRHLKILIAFAFLFLCLVVAYGRSLGLWSAAAQLYRDKDFVAWAGVIMNLAVVGVALFLNVLLERFRQPRFRLTCQAGPPWQIVKSDGTDNGVGLRFVRLKVHNVGRTFEEACEVRIERVLEISPERNHECEPVADHDPRPLKWVGRETRPLILNAGAFDLVDLGIRRSDSPDHFRLDFADRGHLDLFVNDISVVGYRVKGAVYGKRATPQPFTIDLRWTSSQFDELNTKVVI
jgi:hypothetical protein